MTFQVVFEIEGGSQSNGYAAIDEINFNNFEDCPTIPDIANPTTPGSETTLPAGSFPNCDFETNKCGWMLGETPWKFRRYSIILINVKNINC